MSEKRWTDDERDEAFDRGMETMQRVALELYRRGREEAREELETVKRERDDARREADRFRHGCTVEGDFVCPNEYAVSELTAERNFLRALKKNHEEDFARVCKERDEARAELAALRKRVVEALPYPTDDDSDESRTAEEAIEMAVAERDSAYRSRDLAIKMWDEARADAERYLADLRRCASEPYEHAKERAEAFRRGAEAMREACLGVVERFMDFGSPHPGMIAHKMSALPIPEEP